METVVAIWYLDNANWYVFFIRLTSPLSNCLPNYCIQMCALFIYYHYRHIDIPTYLIQFYKMSKNANASYEIFVQLSNVALEIV